MSKGEGCTSFSDHKQAVDHGGRYQSDLAYESDSVPCPACSLT